MTFKAVIFDLDGTLLDTLEDIARSMNRVLVARGIPGHDKDAYRYFVGDGARRLVFRALPVNRRDDGTVDECLAALSAIYDTDWKNATRPYDDVPEMLEALAGRDVKLAVLSNKPHGNTLRCVSDFFPGRNFSVVFGHREGIPLKPDPGAALEIAKMLDLAPAEIVYCGDTAVDMLTATAAGMRPVGVLWGFRPERELRDNGARDVIEHPLDLITLLQSI